MEVRTFKMETDYKMISSWWEGHNWPVVPASSLSRNGLIVHQEGEDLASGFLYATDSDISIVSWLLSNPYAGLVKRSIAVKVALAKLTELSEKLGYGMCVTWVRANSLKRCFEQNGYSRGDEETNFALRFK